MGQELFNRVFLFYKLAQQEQLELPIEQTKPAKSQKEQAYDKFVGKIGTLSMHDLLGDIGYFYDEPYFDKDMIGNLVADRIFGITNNLPRIQDILQGQMGESCKNYLMTYILKRYIDVYSDRLDIHDYLDFIEKAKYNVPENYIRKAQLTLIQVVIEWATNGDYKKWDAAKNLFTNLYINAKKLDKTLLYRLAKHIGPEFYAEVARYFSDKQDPSYHKNLEKNYSDIYDIAEWIQIKEDTHRLFTKEQFLKIMNNANEKAKDYLRTFLYRSDDGILFILGEDMQPMDQHYKSVAFPDKFQVFSYWQEVDPLREVWEPIFDEFNIIPN